MPDLVASLTWHLCLVVVVVLLIVRALQIKMTSEVSVNNQTAVFTFVIKFCHSGLVPATS